MDQSLEEEDPEEQEEHQEKEEFQEQQRKFKEKEQQREILKEEQQTSNASLLVLNSSYRPFLKVRYYDIFPTFLSGIDFDSTLPDTDNIISSVNFAYSYFDIEAI